MRLSQEERASSLEGLPEWRWDETAQAIRRGFRFRDFAQAFSFMTAVALAAEKADHHPDWSNSWNRVHIGLTTHSEGGVTAKDVALAAAIDALAAGLPC